MITLTDFLLARIAEDEAVARRATDTFVGTSATIWTCGIGHVALDPARVLAECDAKRQIVERHDLIASGNGETVELAFHEQGLFEALHFLALPYADHPDYREEWKP